MAKFLSGMLGNKKQNVAATQEQMKAQQEAIARAERDKLAQSQATRENQVQSQEQSARAAFVAGITPDSEESRRKFLKKV